MCVGVFIFRCLSLMGLEAQVFISALVLIRAFGSVYFVIYMVYFGPGPLVIIIFRWQNIYIYLSTKYKLNILNSAVRLYILAYEPSKHLDYSTMYLHSKFHLSCIDSN